MRSVCEVSELDLLQGTTSIHAATRESKMNQYSLKSMGAPYQCIYFCSFNPPHFVGFSAVK